MSKIYFITGSKGQLGGKLKKLLPKSLTPTRKDLDLSNFRELELFFKKNNFDEVIHCAAKTSPPTVDNNPNDAILDNIVATSNIAFLCNKFNKRLVYISTDYVYKGDKGNYTELDALNPINLYSISKLGGECAARMTKNHLVLRLSFGPDIFPYDKAWVDQYTSRETLTNISKKIIQCLSFNYDGILNIGGKRVSVFNYAKKNKKDVEGMSIKEAKFKLPKDTSLDTSLFKSLKNKSYEK